MYKLINTTGFITFLKLDCGRPFGVFIFFVLFVGNGFNAYNIVALVDFGKRNIGFTRFFGFINSAVGILDFDLVTARALYGLPRKFKVVVYVYARRSAERGFAAPREHERKQSKQTYKKYKLKFFHFYFLSHKVSKAIFNDFFGFC